MLKPAEPKYLDEAFETVCKELNELFIKKHHDYGKENILEIKELGISFRLSEKIARIKHLLQNDKQPANESMEESWKDIAIYSIIALLYQRKLFQKLNLKNK